MRRLLVTLSLLTLTAACTNDSLTNPSATNIAGAYRMQTLDGSRLPYSFGSSTLNADNLTLADGGSWSETGIVSTSTQGTQTFAYSGSWSYFGNGVTLTFAQGGTAYTGNYTGNGTLSLTDGNHNYSYSR